MFGIQRLKQGTVYGLLVAAVVGMVVHPVAQAKWYNPATWFDGKPDPVVTTVVTTTPVAPKKEATNTELATKNGAVLFTEKGKIIIRFYEKEAPITVANFKKLASEDFYDVPGMKFHRVIEDFVVQTGDPSGTGSGGSKKTIPLEVKNRLSHDSIGVVAMARSAAPNSASSQFYITLAKHIQLDGKYAVFGEVISGLDVLPTIKMNDRLYGVDLMNVDTVVVEDRKDYGKTKSSWNPFYKRAD